MAYFFKQTFDRINDAPANVFKMDLERAPAKGRHTIEFLMIYDIVKLNGCETRVAKLLKSL